jgi:hypothetical protein
LTMALNTITLPPLVNKKSLKIPKG